MHKPMPASPSSLKKYVDCPRQYQARYVTKEFKESFDSPAAKRGLEIHTILENLLVTGVRGVGGIWARHPKVQPVAEKYLARLDAYKERGWEIHVELEAATDGDGHVCDWWADNCFMRAKIDVLLVSPDQRTIIIWDWKTGKASSINPFQLTFIAQVLVPRYGLRHYGAMDVLLDTDQVLASTIHPGCALPKAVSPEQVVGTDAQIVVTALKEWMGAHVNEQWPERPGTHCRWCQFVKCKFCKWKGA